MCVPTVTRVDFAEAFVFAAFVPYERAAFLNVFTALRVFSELLLLTFDLLTMAALPLNFGQLE